MRETRLEKNKRKKAKWHRRKKYGGISLILLIGILGGSFYFYIDDVKQTPKEQVTPSRVVEANVDAEKAIDVYLQEIGFNGTVFIEDKGKYVMNKGYGTADLVTGKKNQTDSVYLIGSMQKAIIATAFMQLVEQGKIGLDDSIQKYLPHFPNGQAIKIKNFLGHTSGLNERKKSNGAVTPDQIVKDIERAGVKENPGKWHYSDDNYAVIAYLIQQISGMKMSDYVTQHVFTPAGMTTAGFGPSFYKLSAHTASYYTKKGELISAPFTEDMSQLFGAGDMYMTATDVKKFDDALLSGKFISQAGVKRLLQKGAGKYGFGLYDFGDYHISRGVLYGYESANVFTKDHTKTIILLTNARNPATKTAFYVDTRKILDIMEKN
ncbi:MULTISPECIES: serine hydrolase [unclassified Listeria]|uniref:serine hydrolase domain-containing protein n=1 Tax=unclassified Listeria TaxID=2642072 RepID=UPI0013565F84|nr:MULTISPECIES: serine hydrolase domain-containing protein [unclassified Listeria]